jgi:hypothetical protein
VLRGGEVIYLTLPTEGTLNEPPPDNDEPMTPPPSNEPPNLTAAPIERTLAGLVEEHFTTAAPAAYPSAAPSPDASPAPTQLSVSQAPATPLIRTPADHFFERLKAARPSGSQHNGFSNSLTARNDDVYKALRESKPARDPYRCIQDCDPYAEPSIWGDE